MRNALDNHRVPRHGSDIPHQPTPRSRHFGPLFCRDHGVGRRAQVRHRRTLGERASENRFTEARSSSFYGYSSTFREPSSRPKSRNALTCGNTGRRPRSTQGVAKSTRITVKTSDRDQDRHPPGRLDLFQAILIPPGRAHGLRAEAPHMRAVIGSRYRPRADPPCGHAPGPSANRDRVVVEKRSRVRRFRRSFCKPDSLFRCNPASVCRRPPPAAPRTRRSRSFYGKWRLLSPSGGRRPTEPGETPAQALAVLRDTPHFPEEPPFPVKTAAPTHGARLAGRRKRRRRSCPARKR